MANRKQQAVKSLCDDTVTQNQHPSGSKQPGEQMRITTNRFFAALSRLARSMANLVSKNGCFWPVLKTIVLKVHDDRHCVKWAFTMRAVVFP